KGVGVGVARDESGPQAQDGTHYRGPSPAADGVGPEGDAGDVGVHQPGHEDGRGPWRQGQSMLLSIGNDSIAEPRTPDAGDLRGDVLGPDEEEAVALAGEGVLRPVLVRS